MHLFGGHVTGDIKVSTTPGGKKVANFSIAYNPPARIVNGQKVDAEPVFIPCQAWGRAAESIAQRFAKGSAIFAEGELVNSHFKANNGDEVYTNEMRIITAQRPQVTDPNYTLSVISGNLARDPQAGKTGAGEDIVTITVMHNALPYEDPTSGQKKEVPVVAVDVCLMGTEARNAVKYLKKGSQVLVTGYLYMGHVPSKPSGTRRNVLRISASNVKYLRSPERTSAPAAVPAAAAAAAAAPSGPGLDDGAGF